MYKLYTDKQETFECDLFLEGADLKDSSARILVETKDLTLLFPGTIDKSGNCKVPIKKLKGLLGEDTTGNIKLEVIAEDTLIEPWQSEFVVETSKKVTVEVKGQGDKKPIKEVSNKPQVKIKNVKTKLDSPELPPKCYEPVPHEKAGNMKLPAGCVFCSHKVECHKDANDGKGLRAFKYASGNIYFTKVEKLPKVEEVQIIEK